MKTIQRRFDFFVGYVFASDDEVKADPKILQTQRERITAAVKKMNRSRKDPDNLDFIEEYRNITYSNGFPDEETLKFARRKLFNAFRGGHYLGTETLIVTSLDRIAKSPEQALYIFNLLNITSVIILDMDIPELEWGSTVAINLLRMASYFFSATVNEAKLEGRARKKWKRSDYCDGRKRTPDNERRVDVAMEMLDNGSTYAEAAEKCDISVSTITRERRKRRHEATKTDSLQ